MLRQGANPKNLSFILDIDTLDVLKGLILSYLSISDIKKIINQRASDIHQIALQDSARENFKICRNIDFMQFLPSIEIQIDDVNIAEKLTKYIRQYTLNPENNPEFFERAIVHLEYLAPKKAEELFYETLSEKVMDVRLVKLVIENMSLLEIKVEQKQIGMTTDFTYKSIAAEEAYVEDEDGAWHSMRLRDHVIRDPDDDSGTGWLQIISREDHPLCLSYWTPFLNTLLRCDHELTSMIVVRYTESIDEILEGLIELFFLPCDNITYELDFKNDEFKTALTTTASVLSKLDYIPQRMSPSYTIFISRAIAEQRFESAESLNQLILFIERDEIDILYLKGFLPKLKKYIMNAIAESQAQFELIDHAIRYLVKRDADYTESLLHKVILDSNLRIVEILVNNNVKLRLYIFQQGITVRGDIKNIYTSLNNMTGEAKTSHQAEIINDLLLKATPVYLEYIEKEKLIAEIIEKIKQQYDSNNDFKVYYWGGTSCSSLLANKVVPDGIAQIMIEHQSSRTVTQKFNRIQTILTDKHNNIFECCFWKTKRDPRLEKFYCDINDRVTEVSTKKFTSP